MDNDDVLLLQDPNFLMVLIASIVKKEGGALKICVKDVEKITNADALGLFKDLDDTYASTPVLTILLVILLYAIVRGDSIRFFDISTAFLSQGFSRVLFYCFFEKSIPNNFESTCRHRSAN